MFHYQADGSLSALTHRWTAAKIDTFTLAPTQPPYSSTAGTAVEPIPPASTGLPRDHRSSLPA